MSDPQAGKKTLKLILENEISELSKLNVFLEDMADKWKLPPRIVSNINLVIEEVFSNIVFYAFEDTSREDIQLRFDKLDDKVMIIITDNGRAFNPTDSKIPDHLDKPAEERRIGGLGIHFMNTLMDDVNYERKSNKNILSLTKNLTSKSNN